MKLVLSPNKPADYQLFLKIKQLPRYRLAGCVAEFPDEYAHCLGVKVKQKASKRAYKPRPDLFDYQRDLSALAIRKRKFAVFADCGLGKTLIELEYALYAQAALGRKGRVLIVAPLMVVRQTLAEAAKFYGDGLRLEQVQASGLNEWLSKSGRTIGITNYEAITDEIQHGQLGALILDESSMLKSHYGKWGTRLIELGRGLEWKLCLTGTPAPNDRIEYANHAVFLDRFPNVNSFLARYFINRGQTSGRWELKRHALKAFYTALSDWCCFLSRPSVYGWKDNAGTLPPINVHIHDVPLTNEQQNASMRLTGGMFGEAGGFVQRGKLARLAKGISHDSDERIPTHKFDFTVELLNQWPEESTLIWCNYNREQDMMAECLPEAANISGATPMADRERLLDDFTSGRRLQMISKPRVLGFGLNLQVATRQVFSSLVDSYESYYQAVKRSNRVGSTRALNVHIPVTEIERPMVANVLRKSAMVQRDTEEQEELFKAIGAVR